MFFARGIPSLSFDVEPIPFGELAFSSDPDRYGDYLRPTRSVAGRHGARV